ncbi:MAG: hypothetical protein QW568_05175 [Candidatus Anstonellaceae archaeon]
MKKIKFRPEHFYTVLVPYVLMALFLLATRYQADALTLKILEFFVFVIGAVLASELAYKFSSEDGAPLGIALFAVSIVFLGAFYIVAKTWNYSVSLAEVANKALETALISIIYGAVMMTIFEMLHDYQSTRVKKNNEMKFWFGGFCETG